MTTCWHCYGKKNKPTKWRCIPQRYFNTDGRRPPECVSHLHFLFFCSSSAACKSEISFSFFLTHTPRRWQKEKKEKRKTCQDAHRFSVMWFTGEADTREKLRFHSSELQPLVSVSRELWSLEKQRGRKKKKPDLVSKITRAGSASLLLNGKKRWRENSSQRNDEETLHRLHAAEIQMYLSHVRFALSHRKKYYFISIGRFFFSFSFFCPTSHQKGSSVV